MKKDENEGGREGEWNKEERESMGNERFDEVAENSRRGEFSVRAAR